MALPGKRQVELLHAGLSHPLVGKVASGAAIASSLISGIKGKEALDVALEARWVRARATAEAIKRECFLAAAKAGAYAGPDWANQLLLAREQVEREALSQNITPAHSAGGSHQGCPPEPDGSKALTLQSYLDLRVAEQRDWYRRRGGQHARNANLLGWVTGALAGAAALFSGLSALSVPGAAEWIAAFSTAGSSVAAWGMAQRRGYLAASYAAMADRLDTLALRARIQGASLPAVAEECEELLGSEHVAWVQRIRHGEETEAATAPVATPAVGVPDRGVAGG